MLDKFLEVAYTRTKEAEDKTRLVESMRKLPNELLMKIASGEEKLAFMGHGGESWLDKFKGSPLFGQAIQLEEQQLQLDMSNKQQWAAESAKRTQDDAVRDELCVKKKMLGLELAKQQEAQLQHEMTETPEDEAMESPEQQAMEQAQGMEMHPAPAAAAKMAEYLGKSAGAEALGRDGFLAINGKLVTKKKMYAGAKAGVKRYGQLLSGGNRKILEDSAIAPPALRFAPPALRDKLVKQERRSVNIARGATAGGALAAGGLYAATRKDDGKKNSEKEVTASARMKLAAAGYSVDQIDQMEKEAIGIGSVGTVAKGIGSRIGKAFQGGVAGSTWMGAGRVGQLGAGLADAGKAAWQNKGLAGKAIGSYAKANPGQAAAIGGGALLAGYGAKKLLSSPQQPPPPPPRY